MLILKQNAANSVPTPPAGKGTIFLDDSDTLSVKTSDGNVETFPTVGAANSQVVYMNGTTLSGEAALTYNFNTNVLTVSGNVAAGNVLTDNLLYANGAAWDLQEAAGSNTQIQFNNNNNFGASANLTFNTSTNTLALVGTANISEVNTTGNVLVGGNLTVNGNVTYINVDTLQIEDPIISLGGGPNGDPLTSNDGKDRGTALQYFSGGARTAFMGWDNSNAEFGVAAVSTITNDVVTFSTYGNLRANVFLGDGGGLSNLAGANVTGQVGNALVAGTVYTNAQPNITSVGKLTGLLVGSTSATADFPNALAIVSQDNTGQTHSENIGLVGEAVADSGNTATWGIGVLGEARANGATKATGVQGGAYVTNSSDTGAAVGVRGYATMTHAGGYNIGVLGNAAGSGLGNYAFYVQAGNIASIETNTAWDLNDNSPTALSFNSSGKANIIRIDTTDAAEGVAMSGKLDVVGNISAGNANLGNAVTANYFIGSGANLTNLPAANISGQVANALVAGTVYTNAQPNITSVGTLTSLAVTGNVSAGNLSGTLISGTLETAAQPNITSVGTLTGLGVNGNITAANITANTGIFTGNAAGLTNIPGGNVTGQVANALVAGTVYTNAQPNITSVGTLTSLAVTGNVTAGNVYANSGTIGASLLTGTLTTAAQPNVTSVGTLSSLAVTGNVAAGNLTTTGVLSVTGTGVSSIAGNLDMTSNTIINLAAPTNPNDAATKQYVDDIAQGLHVHAPCSAATPDTLANISSGTVTYNNGTAGVGATLTTTGSYTTIDGVNIASVGTRVLVKNEANAAHNGIYVYSSGTVLTRASDFDTPTEMAGGDFTFVQNGTLYNDTGWVMTDPVTTVGTSPVTFVQFSGAGTYTAGTGLTLTGTVFSVNASQTQVTALGIVTTGTWNSLVGSSATFAAGLSGANLASITGANVTGQVANALVAGTVYTAAQPNITSVGTLTGLAVNGNITAANITANTGVFTGNGSGLTALNASNLSTGTVPSARLTGSYSISVDSATTAGTVTTAAQPNITSVGTLTGLTVSGNIVCNSFFDASVNAAVSAAGTVQGNATVIASEINVVSTVASGAGVALPTAVAGVRVTLINTAANALLVYPASGAAINALATNAAYSLPAGGRLEFVAVSTTQWYTLNATYA